eukprot:Rmarinus@m.14777
MRAARQLVNLPASSSAIRSASRRYNNSARPNRCIRLPGPSSTSLLVPLARIVSTICIQHSSVSFSAIPTKTMESCCIYSSPNSSSTAQYRLFSTDPFEDGRNLDAKIAKIELEIADVANQIAKVETAIASAKTSKDLNYFRTEKKQLRAEKDRLLAKEELLLKIELGQDAPRSFSKQEYIACGKAFVRSILKPKATKWLTDASGKQMLVLVGVQVLRPHAPPLDLFVRSVTKPFWEHCITMAENGVRVCAVGSPGIGKSLTSLFAIKLLLEKGKTVVFLRRTITKRDVYYQFTPSSSGAAGVVDVDVFPETCQPEDIRSMKDPNTFYIVDPGMTKDSCNPSATVKAHVIICSSPDSSHWGGSEFAKMRHDEVTRGGRFYYYPIWSLHELLVAGEHLAASAHTYSGSASPTLDDESSEQLAEEDRQCPPFSAEVIKSRFWRFGGIPRVVLTTDLSAISQYEEDQRISINSLNDKCLREMCEGNVEVDAFKPYAPKSSVVAYSVQPKQWKTARAILVSDQVEYRVAQKYEEGFWNYIFATKDDNVKASRFENYARAWFLREQRGSVELKCLSTKLSEELLIPNCKSSEMLMASGAAVTQWKHCTEDNVLYYSKSSQAPFADFVIKQGNTYYVINATISRKRNMKPDLLLRFCCQVAKNSDHSDNDVKFRLIFVVPENEVFRKFRFTLKREDTATKRNEKQGNDQIETLPKNCDVWVGVIGPKDKATLRP